MSKIPLGKKSLPGPISYVLAIVSILGTLAIPGAIISRNVAGVVDTAPVHQRNLDKLIIWTFGWLHMGHYRHGAPELSGYLSAEVVTALIDHHNQIYSKNGRIRSKNAVNQST